MLQEAEIQPQSDEILPDFKATLKKILGASYAESSIPKEIADQFE
jgi:hypothetical protein